jgi:hypothetical protein
MVLALQRKQHLLVRVWVGSDKALYKLAREDFIAVRKGALCLQLTVVDGPV